MKWKNKGHEFDNMERQFDIKNSHYYIWGAGTFGSAFYEEFCNEFQFVAFVDNDEKKQGKKIGQKHGIYSKVKKKDIIYIFVKEIFKLN